MTGKTSKAMIPNAPVKQRTMTYLQNFPRSIKDRIRDRITKPKSRAGLFVGTELPKSMVITNASPNQKVQLHGCSSLRPKYINTRPKAIIDGEALSRIDIVPAGSCLIVEVTL
mmetsp:Transcript_26764/g.79097  ORF Transcript_26764/g.79097 Transcript_26764/m.79097 type:complete len:113 (+) Transcript_26764:211-549(+)